MLSRRVFFLSAIATSAATTLPFATEPRANVDTSGAAQTVLRLERRGIEVNGKTRFGVQNLAA
jgi:hypothetical protein